MYKLDVNNLFGNLNFNNSIKLFTIKATGTNILLLVFNSSIYFN